MLFFRKQCAESAIAPPFHHFFRFMHFHRNP